MALPSVASANYPTPEELLAQILSDLRYSYSLDGIDVNVIEGSDHWRRAKVFADRVAIAIANNRISVNATSPLRATGQDLVDLAGVFGITKRPPAKSAGFAKLLGTNAVVVTLPAGYQATAPNGTKLQVIAASTVTLAGLVDGPNANLPTVQLASVKAGKSTEQKPGTILTWDSASIGALSATCIVSAGGIDGGADEDSEAVLRSRLLDRLRNPGIGGNNAQVVAWAEESTASVEKAYVFASARGPSSLDVAVTKVGGDRTLSSANVAIVAGYVRGQHPGFADINVTAVSKQELDVVLNAVLPLPTNAGGSGGGWRDASPWPTTADSSAGAGVPVSVTAISGNVLTVNSTSSDAPVAGEHFALWDPVAQVMAEFVIQSVGGVSGAYTLTIADGVPSWVTTGMYVSAGAVKIKTYAADFLAEMNRLGPGEKTTSTDILPRGRRFPPPDASTGAGLTERLLSALSAKHSELLDVAYGARYETGTTTTRTSPAVPASTADPPRILVLKHLAIRKAT